ncbi:KpsF/GutQ family sugar-phosphate isomerase [Candidatus Neptunochlamydia vexilliferae]|uniref:Arabinose 5-phosphate isomerase n=1 Tax=Candidatus Neptunichlamydia vexilliferae TaxID=1651774 RepID=A0ABS0B0U1_9BACT|nr:KpsF/GutQ family sugar-phosphate isomerase [Candidatus Neptunochlamydia vexilliferae]MBF5059820.1 putative arabinose 5-phosphate isomerase [Candidatus Neptunochlamydia vexilliferae]
MIKDLFEEYQKNLNYFFDHVDPEKAEENFNLFLGCEGMVIFTGVGKSGIIAEKLAMTMISTGTKALYLPPMNALHGDIGIVTEKDLLVCISKSGESEELLSLVPFARKKGAKTVAWVSNPQSKLLTACDLGICLPLSKELCPFDLAPTTSTSIQLIFGDVLSVALMKAKNFSLDEYALNHPAGAIGKKITLKVEDLMLKGERLPLCPPNVRLRDALVILTDKKCGCLLITDEAGKLQGIFTDGDLRRAFQSDPAKMLEKKMEELMTPSCLFTEKNQRAFDALRFMQGDEKKWVNVMPVVESGTLIGLIRMHDLVQAGIA